MTPKLRDGRRRAIAAVAWLLIVGSAAVFFPGPVAAQSSPSSTMAAYHRAAKAKDFAALRQLLSSEYLKSLEKAPVPMERLMAGLVEHVPATLPEVRNETIAGDKATLEVRNHRNEWETISFVKEQAVWKIAPSQRP